MSGSWSRRAKGDATLGRKGGNTRKQGTYTGVSLHQYNPGDSQRMVVPLFEDENGDKRPLIMSIPVHKVNKPGAIVVKNAKGEEKPRYEVRSMHPYSQTDFDDSVDIAQRGEVCVYHELVQLQNKKSWANARERFGEDLSILTDEQNQELGKFMKEQEKDYLLRPVYYGGSRDGQYEARTVYTTNILLLKFETVEKMVPNAQGIERPVQEVVLDDTTGLPKYTPVLFNLSDERAKKIDSSINTAIDQGLLGDDALYTYKEFEGTEDEQYVNIGWVDLLFNFPEGSKMESGRDLNIMVPAANRRAVTPEFVESIEGTTEGKELKEKAEGLFFGLAQNKVRTKAEQLDILSSDALRLYNDLLEEFAEEIEQDREYFVNTVFPNVLGNVEGGATSETDTTENTEETVEEPEPEVKEEVKEEPKAKEKPKAKASINDILDDLN